MPKNIVLSGLGVFWCARRVRVYAISCLCFAVNVSKCKRFVMNFPPNTIGRAIKHQINVGSYVRYKKLRATVYKLVLNSVILKHIACHNFLFFFYFIKSKTKRSMKSEAEPIKPM